MLRPLLDRRAPGDAGQGVRRLRATDQTWTYAELLRATQETAAALAAKGVSQGDTVLTWLPNGPDALRVWFGVNYLGAVYVPLNLAYRGRLLEHAVAVVRRPADRGPRRISCRASTRSTARSSSSVVGGARRTRTRVTARRPGRDATAGRRRARSRRGTRSR